MPHHRLPDKIDNNARVEVRVNGVVVGTRRIIDFVESGLDIAGSDDGTNDKVTLTFTGAAAPGPGGGAPSGPAGGVLEGTYPNPGLASSVAGNGLSESSDVLSVNVDRGLSIVSDNVGIADVIPAGTYGSEYKVPQITVNSRGQVTEVVEKTIAAGTPQGWSEWVEWTPRMAALAYGSGFVEPLYGDMSGANAGVRFGQYRTNGVEVHARALIVVGGGVSGTALNDVEDPGDTDGFIYLSLPLPLAETFPEIDGSRYDVGLRNLSYGYFPHAPLVGTCTWAVDDDSANGTSYAVGSPTLPPWSNEVVGSINSGADDPPEDLNLWIGAVSGFDDVNGGGRWNWGGSTPHFADKVPIPFALSPWFDGTQIGWTVRYFTGT